MRSFPKGLVLLGLFAALGAAGCADPPRVDDVVDPDDEPPPAPPPPGDAGCDAAIAWWNDEAVPRVIGTCAGCHTSGGAADGTRFQLQPSSVPESARINLGVVRAASTLSTAEGLLLLLKPTLRVPHGGGEVIAPGSTNELVLQEAIDLANAVLCPLNPDPPPGLLLHSDRETLHKASLHLVGRAPTDAELAVVDSDGTDGLVAVVQAQMQEPAFDERVREFYGDLLLTDAFRANNAVGNSGSVINGDNFNDDANVNYFGGEDYDWRSWPDGEGIALTEAIAREPVEFFVAAARGDRSLAEVVTARHRLLNAYSARFYNVDYKGHAPGTAFADIDNPGEFVAVEHVEGVNEVGGVGEYAGVLTTSAWLNRYPSSPTNFNRKRARFVLKYFLDFDIMKAAPRIDAATVDLAANPTRNNAQCTACHVRLDPLAGLFMNQGGCGYSTGNHYRLPAGGNNECTDDGWVDNTLMFAPGFSADATDALDRGARRQALEHLGDWLAVQPEFARAMVAPVFVSLMGRARLNAPANPTTPEEIALAQAALAEEQEVARLTALFVEGGMRLRPLVVAIVLSPFFRAQNTDEGDDGGAVRLELSTFGGGALVTPERLDRKLRSLLGVTWAGHGGAVSADTGYQRLGRHDGTDDASLLLREELKTLYGGIDGSFSGVKARQRQASTLTGAIVEHMALEVSCLAVSRDFELAPAARRLFPDVERGSVDDAAIIDTLVRLHWQLLGEDVAADDADIVDALDLWHGARDDGLAAIAAGDESANLQRPCSPTVDTATGQSVEGNEDDAGYTVRAWQAVIASLLMDPRFVLER